MAAHSAPRSSARPGNLRLRLLRSRHRRLVLSSAGVVLAIGATCGIAAGSLSTADPDTEAAAFAFAPPALSDLLDDGVRRPPRMMLETTTTAAPPTTTTTAAPTTTAPTTTTPPPTTAAPTTAPPPSPPTTAPPPPPPPPAAPAPSGEAADFANRLDGLRRDRGLAALGRHGGLTAVAQAWADHLATTRTLDHNPNVGSQIPAGWRAWGENIGYGASVAEVFGALAASPPHYANMTSSGFTHIGVGVARDSSGTLWTAHVFAKY